MRLYTCEVFTGRRVIDTSSREIRDLDDAIEVGKVFDSILRRLGIPGDGLTLRIYEPGRRPKLLREVSR
jgi:hypothetical protein